MKIKTPWNINAAETKQTNKQTNQTKNRHIRLLFPIPRVAVCILDFA